MKVLHVISGGETGGSKKHLIQLCQGAPFDAELLLLTEGPFAEEARSHGINVTVISQKSRFDRSTPQKILAFIQQNGFSLVHSHGARANFLINSIQKKLTVPWAVTVHSDPSLDFLHQPKVVNQIFTHLNKRALRNAGHLFAVSEEFKNMLMKINIPADKITPVFNGIEFHEAVPSYNRSEIRKSLNTELTDFVYVIVARLHPVKGHNYLLDAFNELSVPNRKLWIVGDGALRNALEEHSEKLGLENRVQFLGPRKDINELLFAADVSLLTSYSESFPLVLLESADMATPVIATDVGGVSALVKPGETGWIIAPGNKPALIRAAEEAAAADTDGMGRSLREFAKENFSNVKLQQHLYSSYLKLINKD
ncbi:glycosyltransferase [Planococcus sp. YIM B11945]|uniref:glycosyltransferase n=1 Tax=Planococcus sp. YIM B11945 TaxID=3435410 RepID=UPI003D7CEF2D